MTQIPPRGTPEFEEYKKHVEEAHRKGIPIQIATKGKQNWDDVTYASWKWSEIDYRIAPDQPQPSQNQQQEPSMTPTEQRIVKAMDKMMYAFAEAEATLRKGVLETRLNRLHDYTDEASQLVTALVNDLPLPSPSPAPSEATAPAPDAGNGGCEAVQFATHAVGDRVRNYSTGWTGVIEWIYPNGVAKVASNDGLVKEYGLWILDNLTRKEAIEAAGAAVDKVLDPNVEAVRDMLLQRSKVGLKKYGVTTDRDDLSELDWHRHHLEELLDAAVYVMRKIRKMEERP